MHQVLQAPDKSSLSKVELQFAPLTSYSINLPGRSRNARPGAASKAAVGLDALGTLAGPSGDGASAGLETQIAEVQHLPVLRIIIVKRGRCATSPLSSW